MFTLRPQRIASLCGLKLLANPPFPFLSASGASFSSLHYYFSFGQHYDPTLSKFIQTSLTDRPEVLKEQCAEMTKKLLQSSRTDPMPLIQNHIDNITSQVRDILKIDVETTENIVMIFYSVGGKHLHASLLLLLAKALGGIQKDMATFAGIIEMVYFANTLHSSMKSFENSDDAVLNQLLSEKAMILGGDFMIGNASIECCNIGKIELVQLLSMIIMNISKGCCAKVNKADIPSMIAKHSENLYYRTASLIANSCQGIALLAGFDQRLAFDFGHHFGMAYGLYTELKELENGKILPVSFPVLYASQQYPQLTEGIMKIPKDEVREILENSQCLYWTHKLALTHIEFALSTIANFPISEGSKGLKGLVLSLLDGFKLD